jgi:hypothetical protein
MADTICKESGATLSNLAKEIYNKPFFKLRPYQREKIRKELRGIKIQNNQIKIR